MEPTSTFHLDIKTIEETGTLEGYASVFNNVDLAGDTIVPGAFSKTIKANPRVPLLYGHDQREVVGIVKSMREDDHGLYIEAELNLDTQRGKEAYSLLKQGALTGMSIGFNTSRTGYNDGKRVITEVDLYEISLVAIPANQKARITHVKDANTARLELIREALKSFIG